jgi:ribosomal-protein-alanine N-acetyltransferase
LTHDREIVTARLRLRRFLDEDAPALAEIIGSPDVARTIMVNVSSAETCLSRAKTRISWHNCWETHGFGIWAVCLGEGDRSNPGRLVGWCGFAPPDHHDAGAAVLEPELLYGIARSEWGKGLASEAARAALDWVFANTKAESVAALIFAKVNPASLRIAEKLGMTYQGEESVETFCPDLAPRLDVIDFELWRLTNYETDDLERLAFETAYRAGLLCATRIDPAAHQANFRQAAETRGGTALAVAAAEAFQIGLADASLALYRLRRPK